MGSVKSSFKPFAHTSLIKQFIKRDIAAKYKGSYLGIVWTFIIPILMLAVYTFVFSVIFEAKWGEGQSNSKVEFALILFSGLIVFNLFSEVMTKAPTLVTSNVNYVKKVVFPLEILPVVAFGTALFHAIISTVILLIVNILVSGELSWTVLLFPIVLLPLFLGILGLSWILSSLGVYIKDIGQIIGVIIPALMFLSPIFYSVSVIPDELQYLYYLNPMTYLVEDARRVLIFGKLPHWEWLFYEIIIGIVLAVVGYLWFKKTRKGFADVI